MNSENVASAKVLDLRIKGHLTEVQARYLNRIAWEIRKPFIDYMGRLCQPHKNNLDWWVSNPASRNPYISPLFHYFCRVVLLQVLANEKYSFDVIKVDSKSLGTIVKKMIREFGLKPVVVFETSGNKRLKKGLKQLYQLAIIIKSQLGIRRYIKKHKELRRILPQESLCLVDTFISDKGVDHNHYYPGLWEHLPEDRKAFVYFVPTFYNQNFKKLATTFKKIKCSSINYLFKENFLKLNDYIYAFGYFLRVHLLKIQTSDFYGIDCSELVKEELISKCGLSSSVGGLLNHRFARRLKESGLNVKLVVNWFENQALDKGWHSGFNKYYPEVAKIGYQGFVTDQFHLSIYPTDYEAEANLLPETIGVIGDKYTEERAEFIKEWKFKTTPAFRFRGVWSEKKTVPDSDQYTILIAIPYIVSKNFSELITAFEALKLLDFPNLHLMIKPHPTMGEKQISQRIGPIPVKQHRFVSGEINDCIEKADLFISWASGTCMLALAKGIPVIVIGNKYKLIQVPIPSMISQKQWKLCCSPLEIKEAILDFKRQDKKTKTNHEVAAEQIRKDYFMPVTKEGVMDFLHER